MGGTQTGAANALAAREARKNTRYEDMFVGKAKGLVKGVGHVINNGVPLSEAQHGAEIMTRGHDTIMKTRAATIDGAWNTDDVVGGISPGLLGSPEGRRHEVHGQPGLDGPEELHRPEPRRFRRAVRSGSVRPQGRSSRREARVKPRELLEPPHLPASTTTWTRKGERDGQRSRQQGPPAAEPLQPHGHGDGSENMHAAPSSGAVEEALRCQACRRETSGSRNGYP